LHATLCTYVVKKTESTPRPGGDPVAVHQVVTRPRQVSRTFA
jgi:hypothetical protein